MDKCELCGSSEVKIRLLVEDGQKLFCSSCYNDFMSEELGIELEPLIESFTLKDYQGTSRSFKVERRVDPIGIFLEASENVECGYKFAVHGELNDQQGELLNRLIKKVKSGISIKQVETRTFPNGQAYNTMIHDQVAGRLEYDETSDGLPLVIIDGKPYTWEDFGKMLITYEGFQFKVRIFDMTD